MFVDGSNYTIAFTNSSTKFGIVSLNPEKNKWVPSTETELEEYTFAVCA